MKNGKPKPIYALSAWTVLERHGKYYIARTASWNCEYEWSKPYASLTRACAAIARHLEREWRERHQRQTARSSAEAHVK